MRLLLVEDNLSLSDWLARTLRRDNYAVDCVHDGRSADAALRAQDYDLVVLDLGLPEMGGLEVLKNLRGAGNDTPVLVLTANDALASKVAALDNGADDYLSKPFDVEELSARVRAQLRRASRQVSPLVQLGDLVFDSSSRQFLIKDGVVALTPRERAVLEALVRRPGTVVRKEVLLERVFGFDDEVNPTAIEVYVHRVRKRLTGSGVEIVTIRGLGYMLKVGHG